MSSPGGAANNRALPARGHHEERTMMGKSIVGMVCALWSLAALAGDDAMADLQRSPAFQLYFQKTFGGQPKSASSLTYGFRVHPEASGLFNVGGDATGVWRSPAVVDLRFNGDGQRSLRVYGASFDSADSWRWDNPWLWLLGIAAGAGVACAAEWGICESGGGGHGYSPPTSPTGQGH
jgi:hypothetical protein